MTNKTRYAAAVETAISKLHEEGRYRTFIDIERRKGNFPNAVWTKPDGSEKNITVWCGNDYLGMGQNQKCFGPYRLNTGLGHGFGFHHAINRGYVVFMPARHFRAHGLRTQDRDFDTLITRAKSRRASSLLAIAFPLLVTNNQLPPGPSAPT